MADREVAYCGGAQNHGKKLKISCRDQPMDSIFASVSSNSVLGSRAMVSFGAGGGVNRSGNSFYQSFDPQENGDEYFDDYFSQPEKKKRLSLGQVEFLERSFEVENKLEPERKTQLANELGLQPRQIAVWFQNRRARWKAKHLETEYETLHASFKSLKTDYDCLLKENQKLKAQVIHLKHNGHVEDIDNVNSRLCDTKELSESTPREVSKLSAKSDATNADSPLLLESGDSSRVFEPDHTDSLNDELLQRAYALPKMDDAYCQPYGNSCGHGFAVEDHAFSFWSY